MISKTHGMGYTLGSQVTTSVTFAAHYSPEPILPHCTYVCSFQSLPSL
ncbi:hypothetical protein SAMN05421547_12415 [Delftia lacustris]|uniref:Uncharacterized protein n=1 Tax=Delftia lacustris TaxID=558537 RepID=A0A1H3SZR0_9BURK|nr:hypothetical protein SAMN05421547_12415 [Delftia lacustris]